MAFMQFIKEHIWVFILLATLFQLLGTFVLALFSFVGIDISENKEAYF